jgi:polysaccharide export outer membrane protein
MSTVERPTDARRLLAMLLAALMCLASGCATVGLYDAPHNPVPSPQPVPTEKCKVSLPAYRIEPPDLLQVELLKMVPKPPYRVEVFDVLQVQVVGTLLDQPIDGYYLIEAEGTVNLGPAYGTVRVAGMTVEEVKRAVTVKLGEILARPEVSVQLARTAGTQPLSGVYLVSPDGTINLRQYGAVHVAGKTLIQARAAIEKHLAQFFDSPDVAVDMAGYNSKVYYVITQGAGLGDNVVRVVSTGNETVLDAIAQVGGLSQLSSKRIWIARPAPPGQCEQILPIDWAGISRGASTNTNYQVLPGDRLFIAEDELIASNNFMGKVLAPLERLLGITGLGVNTVRGTQTLGRGYNKTRNQ